MAADSDLVDIVKNTVTWGYNARFAPYLSPLIISYCNATEPCAFSKAYIDFKEHFVQLKMLTWFANGFLKVTEALEGTDTLKGLENLKSVVRETKHLQCLRALLKNDNKNEAKVRDTLAAHYFQPLAYGSHCIVDKGGPAKCEYCDLEVHDGDTSMGSPFLWHGRADIIVKNSTVKVVLDDYDDNDEDDFASGEPPTKCEKIESSQFTSILEKTYTADAVSQALTEGIVNAFCESKRDKSLFKKFVPSFLTTERHIRIILYNCNLDILLLSDRLEIWKPDLSTLNVDTIVLIWMALNFDNFEMELDEEMIKIVKVSNFQNILGEEILLKYVNDVSKPCPDYYKPRNIGTKTVALKNDGTYFLARQIDNRYYKKILDKLKCFDK